MRKWIVIGLLVMLGLFACAGNKSVHQKVEKAEITTKVAILPLKALDSSSRYITKILTVRDLDLTFDKHANYTLLNMDETARDFKETGFPDVEELEKEELAEISENLEADVIVVGNVSESRSGLYSVSMRFYSTLSGDVKQSNFNVGKERESRWAAMEKGLMEELDNFVSGEMDKIFNLGTNFYNNENYPKALENLQQVVALKPDKVDAYYYLGNTYEKMNNNSKAEETFIAGLELDPREQRIAVALMELYEKTNQPEKRLSVMESLAEHLEDAETWLAVGNLHDQLGNKNKAKNSFNKALELEPENQAANIRLALMLFEEERYVEAIPRLEKAFEFAPDNDTVSRSLATAYQKSGRIQDAIDRYESIIKNDAENVNAYLNLIGLYRADKKDTKAIETANALKRVAPNNAFSYLNLAAIYLGQNKLSEAESNANLTISKDSSLHQPYIVLASVFQSRGTDAYNKYLDLDQQASKAVGKKATSLRKDRDAAKSTAQSHLSKAREHLNSARNRTNDSDAVRDINTRLSRVNDLLSKL